MESSSAWTAKVTATSEVIGKRSVSCTIEGSLLFTVFLSQPEAGQEPGTPTVPRNSVVGRMIGSFDTKDSSAARNLACNGTAEWTIGGTYDPASETICVALRSSAVDGLGTETTLGDATKGATPLPKPFSTMFTWGWQARRFEWGGEVPWIDDAATILSLANAPKLPVIPSEREVDLAVVHSLPQSGLDDSQRLNLDLKDPEPQTITQSFQDETDLGMRSTTWVLALTPSFNIEREDRVSDGRNSFISTDFIRLQMAIPGVTVASSGWASLPSWEVKGMSPLSGSGVPNSLPQSSSFAFEPNPGQRPVSGSTSRNRPIQYTVSAEFVGIQRFFILMQDDVDILRQEYLDHKEPTVPARGDCVEHPIDGSFNSGNYALFIDGGMQAALDKIKLEFGKKSQGSLRVVGGFRSPQRNKALGDLQPGSPHVYGRAIDLVPEPSGAAQFAALYDASVQAGFHPFCEAAPGREVPPGSPETRHVHVDW